MGQYPQIFRKSEKTLDKPFLPCYNVKDRPRKGRPARQWASYPCLCRIHRLNIQKEVSYQMAKLNETYEAMVVFSLKKEEDEIQALTEKFKALIEKNGTLTEEVDVWGKRKLAYAINYETEGYYVVYSFTSKPDFPAELNRVLNITDGVLRALVTTK